MSKISDYKKALKKKEAESKEETVGEYAAELGRKPSDILRQLKDAGVLKSRTTDTLSLKDKSQLLKYLQYSHRTEGPRKKITFNSNLESETNKLIRCVAGQENGAEYEALIYLISAVVNDEKLDPNFQKLINLIVAKSMVIGSFPLQKLGRPKMEELESIGLKAAQRYWELIDAGVSYDLAVQQLSGEFYKSERHIMRLISPHKKTVGETLEKRVRNRSWNEAMYQMYKDSDHLKRYFEPKIPLLEIADDDLLEYFEELINKLASRAKSLTKMI